MDKDEFMTAIISRDTERIRQGLQQGICLDHIDGFSKLSLAASIGDIDLLIRIHREENPERWHYHQALTVAAEAGKRDIVFLISSWGFPLNEKENYDLALSALLGNRLALLEELATHGCKIASQDDKLAELLVDLGCADTLLYMIDQGFDPDKAEKLYDACRYILPLDKREDMNNLFNRLWSRHETVPKQPSPTRIEDIDDIILLIKAGMIGDVIAAARHPASRPLCMEDFIKVDHHGNSALAILGARHELGYIFDPTLWKNRTEEAKRLYKHVPPLYRNQIDLERIESTSTTKYLNSVAGNRFKMKP